MQIKNNLGSNVIPKRNEAMKGRSSLLQIYGEKRTHWKGWGICTCLSNWKCVEFVKLMAKWTAHKYYILVIKLFSIGVCVNKSDTIIHVYWNWTIK